MFRYYIKFILFISFLLLTINLHSFSQGCSDAGVCSAGSMKSGQNTDTLLSNFALSQAIGMGEEHTLIFTSQIDLILKIIKHGLFNMKLPYTYVTGNLGSSSGLGDILITYTHKVLENNNFYLMGTIGAKLPSNKADKKDEQQRSLPMPYQTSLGTSDIMAGMSLFYNDWHFALGYQHPFNSNENGFLHSKWSEPDSSKAKEYFESNKFKRGDDLILRIEKRFQKANRTYFIGILPIYRIQKDEIIDENGEQQALDGSNSVTINLNVAASYRLSESNNLNISLGFPTLFRKVRADGLTRLFVFNIRLEHKFN